MPSPKLFCEFCSVEYRRDELANHVKAKHVKEMANLLVKEYQSEVRITPIIQYACGRDVKNIPIVSEQLEGTYWFGVRPRFFCDSESYQSYLTEQNLACHEAFLKECFESINLLDWFMVGRQLSIQSPEVSTLKVQVIREKKEKEEVQIRLKEAEKRIGFLECRLADLQEENDEKGIGSIQGQEMIRYKRLYEGMIEDMNRLKMEQTRRDEMTASHIQQVYDENLTARREMESQMMILLEQNQALKNRNSKEKDNEMKKDIVKDKKEKEKRKKEKEARKAKEMEKMLRMMAKKMKDSDSSDSDSD